MQLTYGIIKKLLVLKFDKSRSRNKELLELGLELCVEVLRHCRLNTMSDVTSYPLYTISESYLNFLVTVCSIIVQIQSIEGCK